MCVCRYLCVDVCVLIFAGCCLRVDVCVLMFGCSYAYVDIYHACRLAHTHTHPHTLHTPHVYTAQVHLLIAMVTLETLPGDNVWDSSQELSQGLKILRV